MLPTSYGFGICLRSPQQIRGFGWQFWKCQRNRKFYMGCHYWNKWTIWCTENNEIKPFHHKLCTLNNSQQFRIDPIIYFVLFWYYNIAFSHLGRPVYQSAVNFAKFRKLNIGIWKFDTFSYIFNEPCTYHGPNANT